MVTAPPKRGPGRPKGSGDPDAKATETIAIRPSQKAALGAKDPRGWRYRVGDLIEADVG